MTEPFNLPQDQIRIRFPHEGLGISIALVQIGEHGFLQFSDRAAGARYAGIPVRRRVGMVYLLCGVVSSLAAIIYVAHLGQAKADAGNGYELDAITAVVLGGASVLGGRGTLWGTLFGLFFLSILQNGLHLAALPSELTGVLTGTLLVLFIGFDGLHTAERSAPVDEETNPVKNSQVAILCGTILTGAMIVASTNIWLVHSMGRTASGAASSAASSAGHRPVIAVMPKAKGDPYFVSARAGAEEAAKQLGVDLIWDGPTGLDAAKQNELVENWITRQVDAIAVAVENKAGSRLSCGRRGSAVFACSRGTPMPSPTRAIFSRTRPPRGALAIL